MYELQGEKSYHSLRKKGSMDGDGLVKNSADDGEPQDSQHKHNAAQHYL